MSERMSYWAWLFGWRGHRAGIRRFLDRWILLHALVGGLLSTAVQATVQQAANTVLLPLAGIFVGLCFAWAGNAQALLQTKEIEAMARHHQSGQGLREYVFVYQTAILVLMSTIAVWGVAGLGVFDATWPTISRPIAYRCAGFGLFFISSIALRECWHVVLGAQFLLISRSDLQNETSAVEDEDKDSCTNHGPAE
jgi:hypothetical protein